MPDAKIPDAGDVRGGAPPQPGGYHREREIMVLLCLLAAIHVFVFSTAFPFFNNVDEPMHFDLVVKYSHGRVPRGAENVSADSAAYITLFNSCAYFGTPDKFPDSRMPSPPWTESSDKIQRDFAVTSAAWQMQDNYEVSQTPLYYALAGLWWDIGKGLGFHDGWLLYWLRFLNILAVVALVCAGYFAARVIFPDNLFLRLGVPALLAFIPQTVFYSLGNDALSPLCFGATFIGAVKWLRPQAPSVPLGSATGLAFALTFLNKVINVPLLLIILAALVFKTAQSRRQFRARIPALLGFIGCAVPPIIAWAIWSQWHYGDFTGSKMNTEHFGWTVKPFAEWWHHRIFTPAGLWAYLSEMLTTFWQGEFYWLNRPMILPGTTTLYTILSLTLILLALPGLLSRANPNTQQRYALRLALACFLGVLGCFAFLSIIYDFHNSPNPSRDHPYFHVGRLLLGALIPFLLLFVYGLDRVLNRLGNLAKFITLCAMIAGMLAVEIITDWPVFSNSFNWYHLP